MSERRTIRRYAHDGWYPCETLRALTDPDTDDKEGQPA